MQKSEMFDEDLWDACGTQLQYLQYLKNPFKILDDELALEIQVAMADLDEIFAEMKNRRMGRYVIN